MNASAPLSDVIVVGAGIIGLATAYHAHSEGKSVKIIDAADRVVGSSIQNFGHACFTAQADVIQPVVEKSREGWLRAARDAGFWAAESGTWVPAQTELEMAVLEEFREHRGSEQVKVLNRAEVAEGIGNPDLDAIGGAHLPWDARVNPREAAPALAAWLASQGVEFQWNTQVIGVADGVVATTRGEIHASRVIVCPGFQLMQLFPEIAERYEVRVCELVMALVERPDRIRTEVGVLTGTSLARYDGTAAMPSARVLREELAEREPELIECDANLMATGIPEGLLIGDSHAYSLSPEPFIPEDVAALLLDRGCRIFGMSQPKVLQRWQGRYADSPQTNLIIENIDEKTTVALTTSGIGMTLAFGIGELALAGETVPGF